MALMHVTARAAELRVTHACGAEGSLRAALRRVPAGAPVVILVHGFRFRPGDPARDPHERLYGAQSAPGAPRDADWPAALGFSHEGREDGLCLGFGWDAAAPHASTLLREARNGFAAVYDRAQAVGAALAALLGAIGAARPDLEADVFAHSLGARVALEALGRAPARRAAGRVLLLGAAEDAETARRRLPARIDGPGPRFYHFAARHNDAFDALFEAAAPRPHGRRPVALGRAGLGARRADWIDLQLDAAAFAAWATGRGLDLAPAAPRVCHWSFYARPGAMDLHRAILRERDAWSIEALRAGGAPEGLSPPWSRLSPRFATGAFARPLAARWRRAMPAADPSEAPAEA